MPIRSIIDVDVNDDAFKQFTALYGKYEAALKDSPKAWGKVNEAIDASAAGFGALVGEMIAARAEEELRAAAAKEADRQIRSTSDRWKDMAKNSRAFLGNVVEATKSLLRWASLTSVVGGLLGAGGLFGIDRLAIAAGSARRSAAGLGATTGEERAFGVNFGRVVDADSFLSNVGETLRDQSKRYALYGAGLTEGKIAGKDTAQVGAALLPSIKAILDKTPDSALSQVMQARGLDQFMSLQDATRLKAMSPAELSQLETSYGKDRTSLGFSDATAKKWQDFAAQMDRAGQKIESVLVDKLGSLAGPLTDLSESFTKAVASLADSGKLKEWIEDFSRGIEVAAKYVGSDDFQQNVRTFVADVEAMASAIGRALKFLGVIPDDASPSGANDNTILSGPGFTLKKDNRSLWERLKNPIPPESGAKPSAMELNNPLGITDPKTGKFVKYASAEEGLRAGDQQLERYQDKYHLDTIRGIVSKWSPAAAGNDVESYVKDVSHRMNVDENAHLNLHDQATMSKLISAMAKHENKNQNYSPQAVVTVLNNTGGSAVVSTAQLAR